MDIIFFALLFHMKEPTELRIGANGVRMSEGKTLEMQVQDEKTKKWHKVNTVDSGQTYRFVLVNMRDK